MLRSDNFFFVDNDNSTDYFTYRGGSRTSTRGMHAKFFGYTHFNETTPHINAVNRINNQRSQLNLTFSTYI